MDFSTRSLASPPQVQQPPPQENKLVGARKRKPTTISKISSNSPSPQKSPQRDDENENEYDCSSVEPNNNKIQSILSELKFAKQRNKREDAGSVGRGRGRFPPLFNHFGGGVLEEQDKSPVNGLRLPPPPSMMMMPPAHAHVQAKQAHYQPRTQTGTLLQDEPLDLSVDAVDLTKNQSTANLALMMMMMGGQQQGNTDRGDKRFKSSHVTQPNLPSPPPSPPPNIPMDLTRSNVSPRVTKSHYDKVLMIGGKLDQAATTLHEYSNDKVSSSFGSPPSSIGSNAQDQQEGAASAVRNVRKYQKRVKVEEGSAHGAGKGRGSSASSMSQQQGNSGVKPKQRRYRTERPFHCPHCPARFTLRSNMERHGKHQHASVWQRSPSNRVLNKQRALQAQQQAQGTSTGSSSPPQLTPPGLAGGQGNNIRLVLSQQLKRKLSNIESADLASVETLLEKTGNGDFNKYFRSVVGGYDDDEDEEEEEEEEIDAEDEVQDGDEEEEERGRDDGEDMRIDEYDDERFREDFYDEDEVHAEDLNDKVGKRNLRSRTRVTASQREPVQQQKSLSAYSSAPHKISCPHCTRKFPWTSSLRRHLLTHTGQKPFQCSHCPLLFTTKSNCDRHVARKHSSEGGAVTITLGEGGCSSGNATILRGKLSERKEQEVVVAHEEEEEEEEEVDDEEEDYDGMVNRIGGREVVKEVGEGKTGSGASFRCHLCELSSPIRSVIMKHIEATHSDNFALMDVVGGSNNAGAEDGGAAGEEPGVGNVSNRKVLCTFCIRRFWSVEDLRRHMRSHTGERPFSCQYCSRKFTLKHSLIRHSIRHEKNGEAGRGDGEDNKK